MISFKDCTVTFNDEILFKPEWGIYDMAVGKEVVSVFAGPADDNSFLTNYKVPRSSSTKIVYDSKSQKLHKLYYEVKNIRESESGHIEINKIKNIYNDIISNYSDEWLILLEIYELLYDLEDELKNNVKSSLMKLRENNKFTDLIDNGLKLIK